LKIKPPSAKAVTIAMLLVAEAQQLIKQTEVNLEPQVLPQLLRGLAEKLEAKASDEGSASPSS
jgi:hypothetical protein